MLSKLANFFLPVGSLLLFSPSFAQMQACPVNINFEAGNLTKWSAYTGNNRNGNGPSAIMQTYSSTVSMPQGTIGAITINEYGLGAPGIRVLTEQGTDPFGGFSTVPNINGYQYKASILLGSTAIRRGQNDGGGGGYVRGISYVINVPAGPASVPYTMTYAYAMVLENGTHNSNEQPFFSATLKTSAGIITCASPSYYLPTLDNAGERGSGATLDSAAAKANGFSVSNTLSPNPGNNGSSLQDVWTKGWTEVTFDLAPYRGQQVTLTFEADNCIPGGHFSYAYIALRDICAGLLISGKGEACTNNVFTYSIPSLAGATYHWTVPSGWSVLSGLDGNILTVRAGTQPGTITAREVNSCTDLTASINVTTLPSTISGGISSDNQVCAGNNSNELTLSSFRGSILNWLASTDNGLTYTPINNNTASYTARNLNTTTIYKALVQNGSACSIDTSSGATITVDQQSLGGTLTPDDVDICLGEESPQVLNLQDSRGAILNWEASSNGVNWFGFDPANTETTYVIGQVTASSLYRAVVKNGVCPAVNSSVASISLINTPFPEASAHPADTIICYGTPATLNASVTTGTSYNWSAPGLFEGSRNGSISSFPYPISAVVKPLLSSQYMLTLSNAGCPNKLNLVFDVKVREPVVLSAGNDTTAVINQPLQLMATTTDNDFEHSFQWSPATALNNPFVSNPVAVFNGNEEFVTYQVTVTSEEGCVATDDVRVRIFKTSPDIFVPNAFTPGKSTNNLFRPIAAGIASLKYFRVFNRWGQLVYSTTALGEGWNGMVNGRPQGSGSYVWVLNAVNYLGAPIIKKGTVTLVR